MLVNFMEKKANENTLTKKQRKKHFLLYLESLKIFFFYWVTEQIMEVHRFAENHLN